jgi:hypothetical protein
VTIEIKVLLRAPHWDLIARPGQINVLADHLATDALMDLYAAGQPTELYPLPTCVYLRDATRYLSSNEQRTLRTEVPGYELQEFIQKRNN